MRPLYLVCSGLMIGICVTVVVMTNAPSRSAFAPLSLVSVSEAADTPSSQKAWGPEDLIEMAKFYDEQADKLQAEAVAFEQTASSITPLTDTKGFRRSGLTIAAGMRWKEASELRQLAAMHRSEAQRLVAKQQGQ